MPAQLRWCRSTLGAVDAALDEFLATMDGFLAIDDVESVPLADLSPPGSLLTGRGAKQREPIAKPAGADSPAICTTMVGCWMTFPLAARQR